MKNMLHRAVRCAALSGALLGWGILSVEAQEAGLPAYDPLGRNLIFVQGEAEVIVPVDGFEVSFDVDVERGSFEESGKASEAILDALRRDVEALKPGRIEIIKGWDLIKQDKISIGAKGRKLSNTLTVRVTNFESGRLHGLVAAIIDRALSKDPGLVLKNVQVFLTDAAEAAAQKTALTEAARTLEANAKTVADSLGRKIVAPKRIYASKDTVMMDEVESGGVYAMAMARAPQVSFRKSFGVNAQLVDYLQIRSTVSGTYQIE